ncbi:MAG: UPF0182 family protein, partial [Chloroflexota bacterium]|nr:UPF0182 family protein [Chloroflexota bacterium]
MNTRPTSAPRGRRSFFSLSASTKRMLITAGVFIFLFLLITISASFWVDWWWFERIGYRDVLETRYLTRAALFLVAGILSAGFFLANIYLAMRRTSTLARPGRVRQFGDRLLRVIGYAGGCVVFVVFGSSAAARWETWLLWRNGGNFGVSDPTFDRDVGFFVFTLPLLNALHASLLALLVCTLVATVAVYFVRLGLKPGVIRGVPERTRVHILPLAASIAVIVAAGSWLANFELAFSTSGVVYGASFTDVNVRRVVNLILAILALIVGGLLVANIYSRRIRLLVGAVALWALSAVLLGLVAPLIVQRAIVEPAELRRERPYIEQNLSMTRAAYGLENIETNNLDGQGSFQAADLASEATTLMNVRLWDYRVIHPTFQQLQTFVPFYRFHDVDVDRYTLSDSPTQVVISARELDISGLPENAQTWTNRHLAYTHGLGVVVSPVSEVSRQGLPTFLVGQIPPNGQGPLTLEQPEIYFGEAPSEWVILNTEQEEFGGIADGGDPQ